MKCSFKNEITGIITTTNTKTKWGDGNHQQARSRTYDKLSSDKMHSIMLYFFFRAPSLLWYENYMSFTNVGIFKLDTYKHTLLPVAFGTISTLYRISSNHQYKTSHSIPHYSFDAALNWVLVWCFFSLSQEAIHWQRKKWKQSRNIFSKPNEKSFYFLILFLFVLLYDVSVFYEHKICQPKIQDIHLCKPKFVYKRLIVIIW